MSFLAGFSWHLMLESQRRGGWLVPKSSYTKTWKAVGLVLAAKSYHPRLEGWPSSLPSSCRLLRFKKNQAQQERPEKMWDFCKENDWGYNLHHSPMTIDYRSPCITMMEDVEAHSKCANPPKLGNQKKKHVNDIDQTYPKTQHSQEKNIINHLVGGFNPSEKYERQSG